MLNRQRFRGTDCGALLLNGRPVEEMMLSLTDAGIEIADSAPTIQLQTIPGRDGEVDATLTDSTGVAYTGTRDIVLHLYTCGSEDDITAAKIKVGSLHGAITSVRWRALPGEYIGRLSVGQWVDRWSDRRLYASTVDITIKASPCLLGKACVIPLSAGEQTITVKGNRLSWPIWTLTPVAGKQTIAVRCGTKNLIIRASGSLSGQAIITTDPDNRQTRLNGHLYPLTLDSDYFPLNPGPQDISLTGCNGFITYRPRTFI